jgi:hypothetical protein
MDRHFARKIGASPVVCESLESRSLLSAASLTTLMQSSAASVVGQNVTLTAVVTPKVTSAALLTGTVTFKSNGKALQTVNLNLADHAVLTTPSLAVGTDKIVAVFNGSAAYLSSSSTTVSHAVKAAATTTTLSLSTSAAVLGQTVTLKAAVVPIAPGAGKPGGTVTFSDGATVMGTGTLDATGHATLSVYNLFLGSHSITAKYAGSTSFAASVSKIAVLKISLPTGMTQTSNVLQVATIKPGTGTASAAAGQFIKVNYTGYLLNGTKFDSSLNPGHTPFDFPLGFGKVIAGWDQGMVGLKIGEQRVLIVPPSLGYGSKATGLIPANSTLIFIVQMLAFDTLKLNVLGGPKLNVAATNNQIPTLANGTNFGSVTVGNSSPTSSFTYASGGNLPLAVVSVRLTGANSGDFHGTLSTSATGQPLINLTFIPTAKGTRTAALVITYVDPSYSTIGFAITIPLQGTGV